MFNYLIKIGLLWFLITGIFACGDPNSGRSKLKKKREAALPAKDAKVAFVFPAGAGAMRVILGITKKLEEDVGIEAIGEVIEAAGGVSSGSLTAAALTMSVGNPPAFIKSEDLQTQMSDLVTKVFSHENALVQKLHKDYNLTLGEMETIFRLMMEKGINTTSLVTIEASAKDIMQEAIAKQLTLAGKILSKAKDLNSMLADLSGPLGAMINQEDARATALENVIKGILGNGTLADQNVKFYAIAAHNKDAMFFGPPRFASFVTQPYAVATTPVWKALIASSAIPDFIKAPNDIEFAGRGVEPDLVDGFKAVTFDPSAQLYEIYSKQFPNEELLIVYVGNGLKERNNKFRDGLNMLGGTAQKTLSNGKKVTFAAIDAKIVDDKDQDLFYLSGFYVDDELNGYMDKAAEKATKSRAYAWVVKALKAVLGK